MVDLIVIPDIDTFMASADKDEMMLNLHPRVEFLGDWAQQTYESQQMVVDGDFLAIANASTNDRPAPQPVSTRAWLLPDAPAWSILGTTNYILSGVRITNVTAIYNVSTVRIWIPDVSPTTSYRFVITNNITGAFEAGQQFNGDVLSSPGWAEFVTSFNIFPGDDYTFEVRSENFASTTDFNHVWDYTGASNSETDPGTGNINNRGNQAVLRISTTDDDAIDRTAALTSVTPGSLIRVEDEGDMTAYYEYEVQAVEDNGTWFAYAVVLVATGPGGSPPVGRSVTSFEVPVSAPTSYVELTNHFLGDGSITGTLQIGNGAPASNANGYGLDLYVQQYETSPDWYLIPISGSFSDGGANDIFATLTHDTVKTVDALNILDSYASIGSLVTPSRPAGKYQVEFSVAYDFNIVTDSVFFRFRIDSSDPGDWYEFQIEPSAITNSVPFYYSFPFEFDSSGAHTVELETRKQNGSGIFNVFFSDVSLSRIG